MKTNESILVDFIKELNLEVPGVGVCFNADIEFVTATIFKKFNCEVHIITMQQKQLSVLYLIYPLLAENGIPDTFAFDADIFSYQNRKLIITDYDLLRGKFTLSISPIKEVRCESKPLVL